MDVDFGVLFVDKFESRERNNWLFAIESIHVSEIDSFETTRIRWWLKNVVRDQTSNFSIFLWFFLLALISEINYPQSIRTKTFLHFYLILSLYLIHSKCRWIIHSECDKIYLSRSLFTFHSFIHSPSRLLFNLHSMPSGFIHTNNKTKWFMLSSLSSTTTRGIRHHFNFFFILLPFHVLEAMKFDWTT